MTTLNPQQRKAVEAISRPCLVLAGAGSGKTSVITRKIAYLITDCGVKAKNIAAVTFTNKAAREMKERVTKLLPGKQSRGLLVATFHTLGLTIIRKERGLLGLKEGFSIFDADDAKALLKELIVQRGDIDVDMVDFIQHTLSQLKNDMLTPAQALQRADSGQETMIAEMFQQYQAALSAYNAVDFDDLINIPVFLFQQHPDVLERWRQRIHYLLVDEYQDTNVSQYELVRHLIGDRHGLTVVGDDDQSIYAWRGARPENLNQLQVDFPHMDLIKLEQNYRSTSVILDAANTLIANNPHVYDKRLWSELSYGDPIRIIGCANEQDEANRVANEIMAHRLRNQKNYSDYAILYRGNHQSRLMEMVLRNENMPYTIAGGVSFFSRTEVKDVMAYMRLIANPTDDNAFLRIINVPRRKIGTSTLQALSTFSTEHNLSLYDAIADHNLDYELGAAALGHLREFYEWMQNLMYQAEEGNPIETMYEMVDDIGYEAWLHGNSPSAAAAEKRMENVRMLIENLNNAWDYEQEDNPDATIKDAINRLILRDMMERQSEEEETDTIQLLTLHASKGLEYPFVYIIGMEEELLPHRTSIEEDNIEEERRLAYVGITRAREQLTMTYATKRKQFGEMIDTTPSRFLDELPTDNLQWHGRTEKDEDASRRNAEETLAGLKGLFD
ncbi:ATP-dependent DNA helicase Rep [BD1-7 clade bacterium]|uniref:ATP-dependent DNA helicase Rep n=1 Tax=BD1-7 clade bacterium TaxID=2029982 RepID=A0A5S9MWH5_9GAMM|nr:ATP-dependent DNA helicase Rep [BD1-7 clade bacterium]CAA0083243.1 ATP-dependent DNA helicase Rep [BD1-7 clade bacterium]